MIKITVGPVKAGKSKKLIETYENLMEANTKCQVFSSKYSLTQGESIVSRYGTNIKAIPINSLFDIKHHLKPDTTSILIDEFQFLDMHQEELKLFLDKYYYQYDLYIFGLDLDYQRRPFKLMAYALAHADIIEKIGGYCDICAGVPSKYSLRLEDDKPASITENGKLILLDGQSDDVDIKYSSICEKCWKELYYDDKK